MPKNTQEQYRYTQNRELSWLRFDRRVLEEAADPSVPALERLKFVSIFSSNLDEFFMVRAGSLFDLAHMTPEDKDNKTGWTPEEQLRHIYRAVPGLLAMKQQIYNGVMEELGRSGIADVLPDALDAGELKQLGRFFKAELLPVLSPILIGPNHPVPHLVNKHLYAAALLESKKGHKAVGIIPVPDNAPPYLLLSDGTRFVRTENILLRWLPTLFDAWAKMLEESGCQVIYGTEGFKCHSKICLITLRSHNKTSYLTQIGTGNYNEKTNAMYTDLSLMTADPAIGEDAAAFFRNMLINKLDGMYRELCVSPFGIKDMLLRQIDRQIALGKDGYVCIKANSVTEREVIDKLAEASRAGVEVQMIIRGICCILPSVSGARRSCMWRSASPDSIVLYVSVVRTGLADFQ